VIFRPRPLYAQRMRLLYPLDRGWTGPRNGLDNFEKRKFSCYAGSRTANPHSSGAYRLRFTIAYSSVNAKGKTKDSDFDLAK
jgi:hypothetical protein